MKRILFVTTGHTLDDSRVVRKEAVTLANMGYEVIVCGQYRRKYIEPRIKMMDIESLAFVDGSAPTQKRVPGKIGRNLSVRHLYKAYKIVHPDLVVAHEFESACLAYYIFKKHHTPYVFDSHEGYEHTVPEIFPRLVRPMVRLLVDSMLRRITISSVAITAAVPDIFVYKYARQIGKPCAVLYNSPRLDYFPYSSENSTPIRIVHEGHLSCMYGLEQMLDALALVKKKCSFKFVIVGDIEPQAQAIYDKKVKELNLLDNIEMAGFVPWTRIGEIEQHCQIGLCCFQRVRNCIIGMPNKIFSYAACGLAIVGLADSAMNEFIKSVGNGICVDTSNAQAIADAIIYLIEHPTERQKMVENGRNAMESIYGWDKMEEVMKDIYRGIFA